MAVPPAAESPHALVYLAVADRVAGLLAERPDAAGVPVPPCPGWTVADVVAHLAEICQGALGTDPPPARTGVAGLARWWAATARGAAAAVTAPGRRPAPLVLDAFSHELDLRRALGLRPPDGEPEHEPAYALVLEIASGGLSHSISRHGLPGLVLDASPAGPRAIGPPGPVATVRAGRHDLLRTLTGRRTHAQIAELDWSADPAPWFPAFRWGPFSPPPRPVE